MKKALIWMMAATLVMSLFSGCSKPAEEKPAAAEKPAAEAPAAPAADEVKDKDGILKLMSGAKTMMEKGIYYESAMKVTDQEIVTKMWMKGGKLKTQSGVGENNFITIMGGDESVMYNPETKSGFKFKTGANVPGAPAGGQSNDPEKNMDQSSIVYTGKGEVNGEPCYTFTTKDKNEGVEMKGWLHAKYGIVMKLEGKSKDGTYTMEVKNLKVGDVSDSEFQVPADITFAEMPAMPQ